MACLFFAMPLSTHAMLRTVVSKLPLKKMQPMGMMAKSMATLSDDQRKLSEDRLGKLYSDLRRWKSYDYDLNQKGVVPSIMRTLFRRHFAIEIRYSDNRIAALEKEIFDIEMNLAGDTKPVEDKK